NSIGNDILIKNDRYPPIGDLQWTEGSLDYGPSKFRDITVLDNDIYIALDGIRGRLFGYDPQGIMLWAFGTKGNSAGAFLSARSVEHMGRDLLVLDENENSITVFTPTDYGNLIYQASDQYLKGDYEGSADTWRQVLRLNANYNLAFIGIGRSLMRQEHYSEAMEYFKMAHDRENYGRAYRYYRKEVVEKNIVWIVAILVCALIVPLILRQVKKSKMEVEAYEHRQIAR
ncbi:MAG: gluconolactonase, partial [Clostridia bacterium]|nr:gluconolactonase [Clostridia bacterium]